MLAVKEGVLQVPCAATDEWASVFLPPGPLGRRSTEALWTRLWSSDSTERARVTLPSGFLLVDAVESGQFGEEEANRMMAAPCGTGVSAPPDAGVRGGGRYPKVLLRLPWLSGKEGKVGMKEKEKEKERRCFLTVSPRVVKMITSFPPGVCSSRVPVFKTPFPGPEWQDPEILRKVRGLKGMLRVRKSLEGEGGRAGGQHSGHSSFQGTASWSAGENDSGGKVSVRGCVGDGVVAVARSALSCDVGGALGVRRVHSRRADTAHAIAGECKGPTELLEVRESDFSENAGAALAAANAGESDTNLGSRSSVETHSFHNSSSCARVSAVPSAPASLAVVARRTQAGLRFPREGGVSGPAEDLRPVSEVEAGVNFRPAGGVRGQLAGSHFPRGNQARVPGRLR